MNERALPPNANHPWHGSQNKGKRGLECLNIGHLNGGPLRYVCEANEFQTLKNTQTANRVFSDSSCPSKTHTVCAVSDEHRSHRSPCSSTSPHPRNLTGRHAGRQPGAGATRPLRVGAQDGPGGLLAPLLARWPLYVWRLKMDLVACWH